MTKEQNETLPGLAEKVDIRLEIKYRKRKKRFSSGLYISEPVQKLPITSYIKVTNISSKICKGFRLSEAKFSFHNHNISTSVDHDVQVPALNPKESVELELDNLTFNLDGSCWFSTVITPESSEQEIFTYQYDESHDQDAPFDLNRWGCTIYVEGKATALQAKTNNYILLLTLITVLEAVFGLTNMLKFTSETLGTIFSSISRLFLYLASII
ncbi:hypothetical protein QUO07_001641 [Vibrio parahaemolyticus]|nr:hypothetical protein [Vibrio parahaemolyticus]